MDLSSTTSPISQSSVQHLIQQAFEEKDRVQAQKDAQHDKTISTISQKMNEITQQFTTLRNKMATQIISVLEEAETFISTKKFMDFLQQINSNFNDIKQMMQHNNRKLDLSILNPNTIIGILVLAEHIAIPGLSKK